MFRIVMLAVLLIWVAYKLGEAVGQHRQSRAEQLLKQAGIEKDPDRRVALLLEWNALAGGRGRRAFRRMLLDNHPGAMARDARRSFF